MRMTKTLILLVAVLSAPAYAVTDQERSALQRLNAELEAITKIIDERSDKVLIMCIKFRLPLLWYQPG